MVPRCAYDRLCCSRGEGPLRAKIRTVPSFPGWCLFSQTLDIVGVGLGVCLSFRETTKWEVGFRSLSTGEPLLTKHTISTLSSNFRPTEQESCPVGANNHRKKARAVDPT